MVNGLRVKIEAKRPGAKRRVCVGVGGGWGVVGVGDVGAKRLVTILVVSRKTEVIRTSRFLAG